MPSADSAEKVVVVAGPTASGKSRLALDIAEEFDGTVINADSMQLYRELQVLTARPDPTEEARVPHRLYGVVPVAERFSVGAWRGMVVAEIAAAFDAGRLPVLCGGTGLYIKALIDGLDEMPAISESTRAATRKTLAHLGPEGLHARLAERDPEMAARLSPRDGQRICRAWDVLSETGRSLADWQRAGGAAEGYRFAVLLLDPDRAQLNDAIERRFDAMMDSGALDEIRTLHGQGLDPVLPATKALGVPALMRHLDGELDRATAVALAKQATRQFAKRQATWFRHQLAPDLILDAQYSESLRPKIFSFIREFLLTPTG